MTINTNQLENNGGDTLPESELHRGVRPLNETDDTNEENDSLKKCVMPQKREECPAEEEAIELHDLENHIGNYRMSFAAAGNALEEIRNRKLHLTTHKTFYSYCRDRWQFTPQRADQLINAARIMREITTFVGTQNIQAPVCEGQLRPMAGIEDREEVIGVWSLAVERANGKRVTGAIVKQVIEGLSEPGSELDQPLSDRDVLTGIHRLSVKLQNVIQRCAPDSMVTEQRQALLRELQPILQFAEALSITNEGQEALTYSPGANHMLKE